MGNRNILKSKLKTSGLLTSIDSLHRLGFLLNFGSLNTVGLLAHTGSLLSIGLLLPHDSLYTFGFINDYDPCFIPNLPSLYSLSTGKPSIVRQATYKSTRKRFTQKRSAMLCLCPKVFSLCAGWFSNRFL